MIDVAANVAQYLGDRSPVERASSFDYCFNYFQRFRDSATTGRLADPEHLEASCLHLGYYLASWGMLRGSTALHTKSYRFFVPVIETIAEEPPPLWSIDADVYTEETGLRSSDFVGPPRHGIDGEARVQAGLSGTDEHPCDQGDAWGIRIGTRPSIPTLYADSAR